MNVVPMPDIRLAPLGPQKQPDMARHDIICVHTMVGYLTSTDYYFRVSNGAGYDGTESHYGIGGMWGPDLGGGWDGRIWQWQDLFHTADANYQGNSRVISIETADNAIRPIQPWTPKQCASIIGLIAWLCTPAAHVRCPAGWLCRQIGIPPMLVPDTQSFRRGLAYHAQGAAEHTAGEWWSVTPKKDCPTAARIYQFKTIIIPSVYKILYTPVPSSEGSKLIMDLTDEKRIREIVRSELQYAIGALLKPGDNSVYDVPPPEEIAIMRIEKKLNTPV